MLNMQVYTIPEFVPDAESLRRRPRLCHIARIPNEIQDNIFRGTTVEPRAFIWNRSTSASALRALWTHYCVDETVCIDTPHSDDVERIALRSMRRLELMHRALMANSSLSKYCTKLKLAIPMPRYTASEDGSNLVLQLPVAWKQHLLSPVLQQMSTLRELEVVPLSIPFMYGTYKDLQECSTGFEPSKSSNSKISLPSWIKSFIVEETAWGAWYDKRAARCIGPDMEEGTRSSQLLSTFTGFGCIENLHIKSSSWKMPPMDQIKHFTALETLRIDHCKASNRKWFRILVANIQHLQHLQILDLRFCREDGGDDIFYQSWPRDLPNLSTIRLPFSIFPEALLTCRPEDQIGFEVLFPSREVRQSDGTSIRITDEEEVALQRSINAVESLAEASRMSVTRPKRAWSMIKVVRCEWDELYLGEPRFEDDWLEDGFFGALKRIEGTLELERV